ncbi:MAG: VOC family protein [Cyanobacteria bacterium J06632_3]
MSFEFDHLFICVDVGAAIADELVSFGLTEGSSNVHPGQGTANRRFFFRNAMLELLWVHSQEEAVSEPIRRTHLWERWQGREGDCCPFGICLRAVGADKDAMATPFRRKIAFEHWAFRPPYLPPSLSIAMATNSEVDAEPLLFQTPFGKRPDQQPAEKAQPLEHAAGLKEITRVTLVSPSAGTLSPELNSPELNAAVKTGQFELREGPAYAVELGFDGESAGQQRDFLPELPLRLSW